MDRESISFDENDYVQKDIYICKGEGVETYTPSFTYHGFQYVHVKGLKPEQATKELLTYVMMNTLLPERGNFSCSDPIVNALQAMTRRSTLSNFHHFPTDCPQREKNGWTGRRIAVGRTYAAEPAAGRKLPGVDARHTQGAGGKRRDPGHHPYRWMGLCDLLWSGRGTMC